MTVFTILFALLLTDASQGYTVEALSTGITGEECIKQMTATLEEFPEWTKPGTNVWLSCEYDFDQGRNK